MKKIFFFPVFILTLVSLLFSSCDKNNNNNPITNENMTNNEQIWKDMSDLYLWDLPDTKPGIGASPNDFFKQLVNSQDKYTVPGNIDKSQTSYSWIQSLSNTSETSSSLYAGFQYAANQYQNGTTFYVIYYVTPGTSAEKAGLSRGFLITEVGYTKETMEKVTNKNWQTLLPKYVNSGLEFNVSVGIPNGVQEGIFHFKGEKRVAEAPIYTSTIYTTGSHKIGYMVLNHLLSGSNASNAATVMNKLTEFKNAGINNLIIDLRYNAEGGYDQVINIGSTVTKRTNPLMYGVTRAGKNDYTYNFRDNLADGTTIPQLADQLENVYIITGQYTAGPAETLIYTLKAQLGEKLQVYGEKTAGRNIGTSVKQTGTKDVWIYSMAVMYLADKNKKYDYATGIVPNNTVKEINNEAGTKLQLKDLGDPKEAIFAKIISAITGETETSLRSQKGESTLIYLGSSIKSQAGVVEADLLER